AATQTSTVYGRYHRYPELLDLVEDSLPGAGELGDFLGRGAAAEHVDVGPGYERAGLCRCEHHAFELGVALELAEQRRDLAGELRLERILRLAGHVDGDDGDAIVSHGEFEGSTFLP